MKTDDSMMSKIPAPRFVIVETTPRFPKTRNDPPRFDEYVLPGTYTQRRAELKAARLQAEVPPICSFTYSIRPA